MFYKNYNVVKSISNGGGQLCNIAKRIRKLERERDWLGPMKKKFIVVCRIEKQLDNTVGNYLNFRQTITDSFTTIQITKYTCLY